MRPSASPMGEKMRTQQLSMKLHPLPHMHCMKVVRLAHGGMETSDRLFRRGSTYYKQLSLFLISLPRFERWRAGWWSSY